MTQAEIDVLAERKRQIEGEGFLRSNDDAFTSGELARAAACYTLEGVYSNYGEAYWFHELWPWAFKWWKPKDKRRNLVRAAALIIAEIERIDRSQL